MKFISICLALFVFITGCATVAPRAPTPAVVPTSKPDSITINVPNWPMFLYQQGEAFLLLSVKEPVNFPVPKEITFKNGDKVITMPMVKPSIEADKPK